MPRITRKQQKVFAVDAQNNGVFGSLQANDPVYSQDPDVIQSRTAYSNGWDDATYSSELLPPLEEFQGLQYLFSRQLSYVFQEGVPEWETNTTYYTGSICKTISGTRVMMFFSLVDNNQGNLTSDTTKWQMFFDSDSPYAMDNDVVHKSGNETITGNKTFSGTNTFTGTTYLPSSTKLSAQDNNVEGGQIEFLSAPNEPNSYKPVNIDRYNGILRLFGLNSSGNIVQFNIDMQNDTLQCSSGIVKTIVRWGMPDYTAGYAISSGTAASKPSLAYVTPVWNNNPSELLTPFQMSISDPIYGGGGNYMNCIVFPCDTGTVISFQNAQCTLFPLKGV